MSISELIEKLQQATGPSFALEQNIMALLEPERADKGMLPANYTSSIDAAVGLCGRVLPDYGWDVASNTSHILACLNPEYGKPIGRYPHWAAVAKGSSKKFEDGATPAIALCLAILKAKQAQG